MHSQPFVTVVIVNYNSGRYAKTCIDALLRQTQIRLEVIVVDNNSVDDSVNLLKKIFFNQIHLIESTENMGFGRANNLAASQARGDFLLLLNPDTDIAEPNAIHHLIQFMIAHPQYGKVGPAIYEARRGRGKAKNYVAPHYSYPAQRHLKDPHMFARLPGQIAWLLGACLLFKREVFVAIKGFDADYFLYGEDTDIGLRIRQQGFEIGYCDQVKITHVAGTSELASSSYDKWLRKKRGLYLFFCKHYPLEDVRSLCRYIKRKSTFSLYLQQLRLFFQPTSVTAQNKAAKSKAEMTAAAEVLAKI